MPEPLVQIGEQLKSYPVLGQKGLNFDGATLIDSGTSISGMSFYLYECYGDSVWDPRIENGRIQGKIVIKDAFGKKASCKLAFGEKTLEEINKFAPGIDKIITGQA